MLGFPKILHQKAGKTLATAKEVVVAIIEGLAQRITAKLEHRLNHLAMTGRLSMVQKGLPHLHTQAKVMLRLLFF